MLPVFCADIGSVQSGHFAWYGGPPEAETQGDSPASLADAVASLLMAHRSVALGFECPLFVPLPAEASQLARAREGEGDRPWSAAAGAASLATGLTQVPWILRAIRATVRAPAFLKWADFQHATFGLFLWEAFVSGSAKGPDHVRDARRAVEGFRKRLPDPSLHSAVKTPEAFSLIGAALLRTGWKTDPSVLSTSALVIRTGEK